MTFPQVAGILAPWTSITLQSVVNSVTHAERSFHQDLWQVDCTRPLLLSTSSEDMLYQAQDKSIFIRIWWDNIAICGIKLFWKLLNYMWCAVGALIECRKSTYTVPVSAAGLCVTHWASGSSFAENYIRLTFSRVWDAISLRVLLWFPTENCVDNRLIAGL